MNDDQTKRLKEDLDWFLIEAESMANGGRTLDDVAVVLMFSLRKLQFDIEYVGDDE